MPRRPVRLIAVLALGVALVLAVGGLAGPSAAAPGAVAAGGDPVPAGHGHGDGAADPLTAVLLGGTLLFLVALAVGFVHSGRRRRAAVPPAATQPAAAGTLLAAGAR